MPTPIPNKLHFIWLGPPMRPADIQNMLKWTIENPNYQVHLWCEFPRMELNQQQIAEICGDMGFEVQNVPQQDEESSSSSGQQDGNEGEKQQEEDGTTEDDPENGSEQNGDENDPFADSSKDQEEDGEKKDTKDSSTDDDDEKDSEARLDELPITFAYPPAPGGTLTILIKPISIIPALRAHSMLYEETTRWKNFGAASDILRIWVLHFEGGIYMDFDTFSDNCPLPTSIEAPHDILFAVLPLMPIPCNALIAAPAGAKPLEELAKTMEERYIYTPRLNAAQPIPKKIEYVEVGNGLGLQVTDNAHRRLERMQLARERMQACTCTTDPEYETARMQLAVDMLKITCWRSGPFLMADYVDKYAVDDIHLDQQLGKNLFFFQHVTGYQVRIDSASSWIR